MQDLEQHGNAGAVFKKGPSKVPKYEVCVLCFVFFLPPRSLSPIIMVALYLAFNVIQSKEEYNFALLA